MNIFYWISWVYLGNLVPACPKGQCPPCRLRQKSSSRGPCTCELCLRQCLLPALPAVLFGLARGVVTCYRHTIMVCLQCLRELCTCNSVLRRARLAQAVARLRQVRVRQPSEPSVSAHTRYATPLKHTRARQPVDALGIPRPASWTEFTSRDLKMASYCSPSPTFWVTNAAYYAAGPSESGVQ